MASVWGSVDLEIGKEVRSVYQVKEGGRTDTAKLALLLLGLVYVAVWLTQLSAESMPRLLRYELAVFDTVLLLLISLLVMWEANWLGRIMLVLVCWFSFAILVDMPYAAREEYRSIRGQATEVETFSTRLRGPQQHFRIDGVDFSVETRDLPLVDKNIEYQVTYLPHSKFVMDISAVRR